MSNAVLKCPCHSTAEAHEAYVAAFVASLLDGSRYAGLPEADDYEGGVDVERALEVR